MCKRILLERYKCALYAVAPTNPSIAQKITGNQIGSSKEVTWYTYHIYLLAVDTGNCLRKIPLTTLNKPPIPLTFESAPAVYAIARPYVCTIRCAYLQSIVHMCIYSKFLPEPTSAGGICCLFVSLFFGGGIGFLTIPACVTWVLPAYEKEFMRRLYTTVHCLKV